MRLDLGPSIETVRLDALALIDKRARAAAEAIRPAHLAAMDALRLREAREAMNTIESYCVEELFPTLHAIPGTSSIRAKAMAVVDASEQVSRRLLVLEKARLAAKAAIREAATVAEIRKVTLDAP